MAEKLIAIVLAGQRPGPDRVAAQFGLKAKALVPVLGRPMIDRVLSALQASPRIASAILVEDPSLEPLSTSPKVAAAVADGFAVLTPTRPKISQSVAETIREFGRERSYLVTTADNPLMTPDMIEALLAETSGADIVVGMAEKSVIEAAYPDIPRTYYQFRDTAISGANLFFVAGDRAFDALGFWAHVEAHRKRPLKLFSKFGWLNLALMATRRLTLAEAFDRLSTRIGCTLRPARLPFAEAAIDVDKPVDLLIAEGIVARDAEARAS